MSQRLRLSLPNEEDRISDLPDSLLHHILSFLPTKDATVTILPSKRWKSLLSQSIINLDDNHFPHPSAFCKFFNSFIASRDKNLPIVTFNLKCHHKTYREKDIPNLVSTALQRQLENLIIDFCNSNFPSLVPNTKTLTFLKLKSVTILRDPDVDLPSLKVLHLESVTFGQRPYLSKILRACPIIHDLVTKDLAVKKLSPTLLCPIDTSLSKLVRANISGVHIYFDQLQNVEHLRLHVVCYVSYSYQMFIYSNDFYLIILFLTHADLAI